MRDFKYFESKVNGQAKKISLKTEVPMYLALVQSFYTTAKIGG